MKIVSEDLLDELAANTTEIIAFVENLKSLSMSDLNQRVREKSWSILECLQHLNLYGDFYLNEISMKMARSEKGNQMFFKSGFLGNYFAKSMMPKEKLNKMKTFKSMDPIYTDLDRSVIDTFLIQQNEMLRLLEIARSKDLTKVKTNISISKWIRIRLGDTFRFVIYHNVRHVEQVKGILVSIKGEVLNTGEMAS